MPAGNDLVMSRSLIISNESRSRRSIVVFEAAVEVAQEVTAVGAIEIPERGRLTQRLGDETHAIGGIEMSGRKPRIQLATTLLAINVFSRSNTAR